MSKVVVTQYSSAGNVAKFLKRPIYRTELQLPGRIVARDEIDGGGEVTFVDGASFIKIKASDGNSTFVFTGEPAEQDSDHISAGEVIYHGIADESGQYFTAITFTDAA